MGGRVNGAVVGAVVGAAGLSQRLGGTEFLRSMFVVGWDVVAGRSS